MAEDGTANINLTAAESKLLTSIMKNLTTEIQFDASIVASELGYKDGTIAKARWNTIKRTKLSGGGSSSGSGVQKRTPNKKSTPKKGKADDGAAGGDDEEVSTPTKTPKKRGRKPKAETVEDGEAEVKQEDADGAVETTEKVDED